MIALLRELKKKVVIGFVGGSDLAKITEQLGPGECQPQVMIRYGIEHISLF
jgi:Eukaryotic phosphomannomutase